MTSRPLTHAAGKFSAGLRPGLKALCEWFQCGRPKGTDRLKDECPGARECLHGAGQLAKGTDRIVDPITVERRREIDCGHCLELLAGESKKIQEAWARRLGRVAVPVP